MTIQLEKFKKLLIGIIGIYTLYFIGGIIQQRIMKIQYENTITSEKSNFSNSNAFTLFPSISAWAIGSISTSFKSHSKPPTKIPIKNSTFCALFILMASLAMNRAIYITSFPLVSLFKSCNLLSVLSVGLLCSRVKDTSQKLTKKNLISGLMITSGVLLYHLGAEVHQSFQGNLEGIILLTFSLICDGFLPDFQAQIKTKYHPTAMQMFTEINKWKTVLSFFYALLTFQIKYIVFFFIKYPLAFLHVMILSLTGAFGQIVVYWMISNFKQHVVPFIVTTRKLFTVVISILLFKHQSTSYQVFGIFIVFATVIFGFLEQIRGTNEKIEEIQKIIVQKMSIKNKYQKISTNQSCNQIIKNSQCIEQKINDVLEKVTQHNTK